MKVRNDNLDRIARIYFLAKKYVIQNGYSGEIDWQEDVSFANLNYQVFLKEYSWVVLASGLSDKVVSKVFPKVQNIFQNWDNLDYIIQNYSKLESNLLMVFNNKPKINALLDTVVFIYIKGFNTVKNEIRLNGINFLKSFSFIGETTCFHLAKNIGLSYAKPDRHLLRISNSIGFNSPHILCKLISEHIAEKIQVVDLVLWRYATLDNKYEAKLQKLKPTLNLPLEVSPPG
jgi:hypothetical protein